MTHEEIETHRRQLQDILAKGGSSNSNESAVRQELRDLAIKVGASTAYFYVGEKNHAKVEIAPSPVVAQNIHQALQTASMIDACRTAARNHEIASKAQKSAGLSQWIALGAMLAAVASAVAAWFALG